MLHDFWTSKICRLCSLAKRTMVFGRSNYLSPEIITFNTQKNLENTFTIKFQPQNTDELSRTWQIKHASRAHKASWSQILLFQHRAQHKVNMNSVVFIRQFPKLSNRFRVVYCIFLTQVVDTVIRDELKVPINF